MRLLFLEVGSLLGTVCLIWFPLPSRALACSNLAVRGHCRWAQSPALSDPGHLQTEKSRRLFPGVAGAGPGGGHVPLVTES